MDRNLKSSRAAEHPPHRIWKPSNRGSSCAIGPALAAASADRPTGRDGQLRSRHPGERGPGDLHCGRRGRNVAVIDTGVDYKNPAFGAGAVGSSTNKVVAGVDFTGSPNGDPADLAARDRRGGPDRLDRPEQPGRRPGGRDRGPPRLRRQQHRELRQHRPGARLGGPAP